MEPHPNKGDRPSQLFRAYNGTVLHLNKMCTADLDRLSNNILIIVLDSFIVRSINFDDKINKEVK